MPRPFVLGLAPRPGPRSSWGLQPPPGYGLPACKRVGGASDLNSLRFLMAFCGGQKGFGLPKPRVELRILWAARLRNWDEGRPFLHGPLKYNILKWLKA